MGKDRKKRTGVPRKPSLTFMRGVLTASIKAEFDKTIDEKNYVIKQLEGLLKDERALRGMMECKHENIVSKDGVFICKDCQWCGWK